MKIYFEDGPLQPVDVDRTPFLTSGNCYTIDAKNGVSACLNAANYLLGKEMNGKVIEIYTNCFELFDNEFAWNDELKVSEIYIRNKDTNQFVRIDSATDRELREGHNLAKLYIAGEFDSVSNTSNVKPVFGFPR